MNIKNVTVTVSASKNYQKYDISAEVDNVLEGDLDVIRGWLIPAAVDGLNALCENVGPVDTKQPTVTTQIKPKQNYTPNNGNQYPRTQNTGYNRNANGYGGGQQSAQPHVTDKQKWILSQNGYDETQINNMSLDEVKSAIGQIFANQGR